MGGVTAHLCFTPVSLCHYFLAVFRSVGKNRQSAGVLGSVGGGGWMCSLGWGAGGGAFVPHGSALET